MHGVVRCALATIVVATSVVVGPADTSAAAAHQPLTDTVASVLPTQGQVVGVAHPIVLTFGAPVSDRPAAERALDIKSSPAMTGKFVWLDNTVAQWVPDGFWPAHSTVALSVGGRKTNFATGPAVVGVANIADHSFTVTVDGVDAGPPSALPAPHHRPYWGKPGVFPASMGRPEYPTPVGTYSVLAKERDVKMDSSSVGIPVDAPDGYLLDVEYAVRFTNRGLFVHAAPWAVNALGYENVSHGCISLSPEDAEWYFNTVNVGDPVIVQENSVEIPRPVAPPDNNVEVPRPVVRPPS
jgi:lipoprotein-anchoring transpeptidase ErfK/SrfK